MLKTTLANPLLFNILKLESRIHSDRGLRAVGLQLWIRTSLKRSYAKMFVYMVLKHLHRKSRHYWLEEKALIKMRSSLTKMSGILALESWLSTLAIWLMCWSHSNVARRTIRLLSSDSLLRGTMTSSLRLGSICARTYHPFSPGEGPEWSLD